MKKFILATLTIILIFCESFAYTDETSFGWAVVAVNKWNAKGLVSGYNDGSFRGNNYITRAEVVAIANRLNNSGDRVEKRPSKDVESGDWFYRDMGLALKNGLIKLDANANLRPTEYATREDAAVILANLFNLTYGGNSYEFLSGKFSDFGKITYANQGKIAAAVDFGLINGYPDGTLRPSNNVTRAEFVSMINNCIDDVCSSGRYSNRSIGKSLIINGEGVTLNNVDVKGKIFVLDGAEDELPYINNSFAAGGIISRVGEIETKHEDEWETVTARVEDEPEPSKPISATVTYSETGPTNESVKVTVKLDDRKQKIVNNNGKNTYTFKKNGEFTFIVEDENGEMHNIRTEVNNIDLSEPRFEVTATPSGDKATVALNVLGGLIENIKFYYAEGNLSAGNAIRTGRLVNGLTFEAENYRQYTIVAKDDAGNEFRKFIDFRKSRTITVTSGEHGTITPGTTSVLSSTSQTFTIIGNAGYTVDDVLIDGESVGAKNSYTFSDVMENHTISATFKPAEYTVTFDTDGGSTELAITAEHTSTYGTLPIPTRAHSVFIGWYDSNTFENQITATSIVSKTESHTLYAKYDVGLDIIATTDENGAITPTGTTSKLVGESQTYRITPNVGYHIKDVTVDEESKGNISTYTFIDIQTDHVIDVTFEAHTGGTATCLEKAECSVCHEKYGSISGHLFTIATTCTHIMKCEWCDATEGNHVAGTEWQKDGINHWKVCTGCTERMEQSAHSGGSSTCEAKATCEVCNGEYGEFGHSFIEATACTHIMKCANCDATQGSHIAGIEWQKDATNHWKVCTGCTEIMNLVAHSGGTATCQDKAVCEVCGQEYGELAEHGYTVATTCTHIMKCEWCDAIDGSHVAGTEWQKDGINHWKVCTGCTEIMEETAHSAGTATCQAKAICEVCGQEYGELVAHNYTRTTSCVYIMKCEWCELTQGSHEADSNYISDATNHWNGCTGGCHERLNLAAHSGGDWQKSETEHWRNCAICSCEYERGSHSFLTDLGTVQCICGQTYINEGIPNTDASGANAPVIGTTGLIPLNWDIVTASWVETDEVNWKYNYNPVGTDPCTTNVTGNGNGAWANAKDANGNFYVWIPRYTYVIESGRNCLGNSWNAELLPGTNKISIKFSNGIVDDRTEDYLPEAAFTFGANELRGFWMAKYQASPYNSTVRFIPRQSGGFSSDVGTLFDKGLNAFTAANSHMLKNSEWGAAAYLTNAIGKIPYINNTTSSTGSSADKQNLSSGIKYAWNTVNGTAASTTHNVYGIYDMSGGNWEFVAAYIDSLGADLTLGGNLVAIGTDEKYREKYQINSDGVAWSEDRLGDAVFETSSGYFNSEAIIKANNASWDGDASTAPNLTNAFFTRGGGATNEERAGIYAFGAGNGNASTEGTGFRVALSIY